MKENIAWILLALGVFLGIVAIIVDGWKQKHISKNKLLTHLHNGFECTIGIYATVYSLFVILFNAVGISIHLPQDDSTLSVALFYGGIHIMYPYISRYFRFKKQ